MKSIEAAFKKRKPFIGYLCAGDGGLNYSIECAHALIEGGVDILEIGLPFSDPVADGVVIQAGSERALKSGASMDMALKLAEAITTVPVILMTYANPFLAERETFLLNGSAVDGVLLVDLPPNDSLNLREEIRTHKKATPMLLSSTTSSKRAQAIAQEASGFLYYVAHKGTTGVRQALPPDFATQIQRLKKLTDKPIVAGFGIGNAKSAKEALTVADGFVVGSAFVKLMATQSPPQSLKSLAQEIALCYSS